MKALIVGDYHATPQELKECKALADLIYRSVVEHEVELLILLGDQYHHHAIANTAVIDFWQGFLARYRCDKPKHLKQISMLVGNHDFYSPTIMKPHTLITHIDPLVNTYEEQWPQIVDEPTYMCPNVSTMPYYPDPEEFLKDAIRLKERCPDNEVLICHQTFNGATFSEGFYAKDAVNPASVPFKYIISGHIHNQHAFGNVWYPGSPRWRTLSDANEHKYIYVVDLAKGIDIKAKIPTYPTCRRIVKLRVEEFVTPLSLPVETENIDYRVDIYGSQTFITEQTLYYKSKLNARCRPFPTNKKTARLTESDGIIESFNKYSNNFKAPKGTDNNLLLREAGGRLNG